MSIPDLHALLTDQSIATLLAVHPNDAAGPSFVPPGPWRRWWPDPPHTLPLPDSVAAAQLPRHPTAQPPPHIRLPTRAMSQKKQHEVSRMTHFLHHLLATRCPRLAPASLRIVDVGAGQAYLTRALHSHFGAHTLALDSDHAQTMAAESRAAGHRIDHKTIHITPTTLLHAIDGWVPSTLSPDDSRPVPVLLVALHACGSLTPDIFRAFLSAHATEKPLWLPVAAVVVGCCYNLMHPPTDFPLSAQLLSPTHPFSLPPSAFQLAAQVPAHWSDTPRSLAAASLATRKVVWRALLGRLYEQLHQAHPPSDDDPPRTGTGSTPTMRRLGRLPNAAYDDWPTFLRMAGQRVGVDFLAPPPSSNGPFIPPGRDDPLLERRLEILHVLRCHIGPAVESLIVLDRVAWVQEQLEALGLGADERVGDDKGSGVRPWETNRFRVEAVNLFDQATGSGRNIALVVAPPAPDVVALSL